MANKPIVTIDVDDAAFKRFHDLFEKYAAKVEEMPAAWKKLDAAMNGAGKEFAKGSAATNEALAIGATSAALIVEAIERASKAQVEFRKASEKTGGVLDKMAASAKGIAGAFAGMRKMLEYGGIGGALLGAGGALGVVDLAGMAMDRQIQARGAGVSAGMLSSFDIYMKNIGGASFLQQVANAQFNPQMQSEFAFNHISGVASQSPAMLAMQIADAARRAYLKNPTVANVEANMGLFGGLQPSDLRNLGAMSNQEWAAQKAKTISGARTLAVSDDTLTAWANLEKTLETVKVSVLTSLTNALVKLAPPLETMATSFSDWVSQFAKNGNLQKAVGDFATNAELLGDEIMAVAQRLKWLLPTPAQQGGAPPDANARIRAPWDLLSGGYDFSAPNSAYGLPKGLLSALAKTESGYNPNAVSKKGALGLFQIMPDVAKSMGINPLDAGQATYAAAQIMQANMKKYGDLKEAIAAYNWGQGNLDADLKAHGAGWMQYAPAETQNEITKVLTNMGLIVPPSASPSAPARNLHWGNPRGSGQSEDTRLLRMIARHGMSGKNNVTITNNTAAQVHRSANAAAAGG